MKLAAAEAKAVKFVLLIIALSALARLGRRPDPIAIEKPPIDASSMSRSISGESRREAKRGPIDPNRASLVELDRLPGIGEATARKIIAARPLTDLNDLAKVVGRKRAEQLAPLVTLRGELATSTRPDTRPSEGTRGKPAQHVLPRPTQQQPISLSQVTAVQLE